MLRIALCSKLLSSNSPSACRSLCMAARHNCEDIMKQFDYSWPAEFECSKFPVGGNPERLCVGDTDELTVGRIEDFSKYV